MARNNNCCHTPAPVSMLPETIYGCTFIQARSQGGPCPSLNPSDPPPLDRLSLLRKMSFLWAVLWASKMHWRPRLRPGPHWESLRCSPRPLSRLRRGHQSQCPTSIVAFGASILAPSALRCPCPPVEAWCPTPADLELATVLPLLVVRHQCSMNELSTHIARDGHHQSHGADDGTGLSRSPLWTDHR